MRVETARPPDDRCYSITTITLPPDPSREGREISAQELLCTVYIILKNRVPINL